jgi:hypothetical protein
MIMVKRKQEPRGLTVKVVKEFLDKAYRYHGEVAPETQTEITNTLSPLHSAIKRDYDERWENLRGDKVVSDEVARAYRMSKGGLYDLLYSVRRAEVIARRLREATAR